jgi:hypothetical protein
VDNTPLGPAEAIAHSYRNRNEIEQSEVCACFHCFARFAPIEIRLWTHSDNPDDDDPGAVRDDTATVRGMTAICPRCEYDAVIGSAIGVELSEGFLRLLRDRWYGDLRTGK